jgi:hypothetical protein
MSSSAYLQSGGEVNPGPADDLVAFAMGVLNPITDPRRVFLYGQSFALNSPPPGVAIIEGSVARGVPRKGHQSPWVFMHSSGVRGANWTRRYWRDRADAMHRRVEINVDGTYYTILCQLLIMGGVEENPGPLHSYMEATKSVNAYVTGPRACTYDDQVIKPFRFGKEFRCGNCHVMLAGPVRQLHPKWVGTNDVPVTDASLVEVMIGVVPAQCAAVAAETDAVAQAAPSAPPCPTEAAAPASVPPPVAPTLTTVPPTPGTPGPAPVEPAPTKPVPKSPKQLDGRRLTQEEAEEFSAVYGGRKAALRTIRVDYDQDSRLVTNRSVKETQAAFVMQEIMFTVAQPGLAAIMGLLLAVTFVVSGIAGAYVYSYAPLVVLTAFTLFMMFSVEASRRLLKNKGGKTAQTVQAFRLLALVGVVDAALWLVSCQVWACVYAVLCVGACIRVVRRYGIVEPCCRWLDRSLRGHRHKVYRTFAAVMVALSLGGIAIVPFFEFFLSVSQTPYPYFVMRVIFGGVLAWSLTRFDEWMLALLFPDHMRIIKWCPHMISCVIAEYEAGTNAEAVRTNTRCKLLRLATLPIPDTLAMELTNGSEQVIYFLMPRMPFFAVGPTHLGSDL